ncbi:CHAT domain-containing protein [Pyxidicoccus fallax]|uniref:CHAT domain-containing protein n=1 Tax=Pyxidicoccus fallax TaxID=394095 RepID=A0A848LE78_9BACT|nr:CHAT domain-containing protein [Pyxidicoccus fallax]NMO16512.1 CHAT domain-containing protein [Pyxidicoccus fallax]NPC77426.1 CHAT domain-containing protein [Pyxidicoccus fallax]
MSAPDPMDLHDQVQAFADGELSQEEADTFREHLATCAQCQADLDDILQLQALSGRLVDLEAKEAADASETPVAAPPIPLAPARRAHVPEPGRDADGSRSFRPAWSQRRGRVAAAVLAGALAAVFALVAIRAPVGVSDSGSEALALAPTRSLEARLSWSGASAHRPYGVLRSGEERPKELVPLKELAKLEEAGDLHGLATGHLLRGEREQAAEYLQRAPSTPDVDSDRAVVALAKGELESALILLDGVLEKAPQHPQALWNRALVLRELGLDALAAEAFDTVSSLREPGWAEEAKERAAALRRGLDGRRGTWDEAQKAGKALALQGTPFPDALARAVPGSARKWHNLAVWAAPDAERVKALLPLARLLDAHYGGDTLERYTTRVAGLDFKRRAPLAARFRQVLEGTFDASGLDAYVRELEGSENQDLLLGVLPLMGVHPTRLDTYEKAAKALGDPWVLLNSERERALSEYRSGDLAGAEARLLRAVAECNRVKADVRCGQLEHLLAHIYKDEHRLVESREHVLAGFQWAQRTQEWELQTDLLRVMGDLARFRNAFALTRAYLGEQALRDRSCEAGHHVHESLAAMHIFALRPDAARAELAKVPTCEVPFFLNGAYVLADLARLAPRPDDVERVRDGLRKLREGGWLRPGEQVLATHIEGRAVLTKDREAGHALLRKAIADGARLGAEDPVAVKARAYSYSSLIQDAGFANDWAGTLALFAEELGTREPGRCELGVEVHDERTVVAARGPAGELLGHADASRRSPDFDVATLVPPQVVSALKPCEHVRVFARYPVHGQAGLLPADLAWSYQTGAKPVAPAAASAPRPLVVYDVEAPASLNLPRLRSWELSGGPSARRVELTGAAATPSRLLAELAEATEVEIHAHGLVNLGVSDASLLVMAPEADGRYALTAGEVRRQKFKGAPVVLLGACQAARTAPYLHAPWSLPVAFAEAGARAVIASPIDIPDAEAGPFFARVMERIRAGTPAAVALRDERLRVLSARPESWVKTVVVFE